MAQDGKTPAASDKTDGKDKKDEKKKMTKAERQKEEEMVRLFTSRSFARFCYRYCVNKQPGVADCSLFFVCISES